MLEHSASLDAEDYDNRGIRRVPAFQEQLRFNRGRSIFLYNTKLSHETYIARDLQVRQ